MLRSKGHFPDKTLQLIDGCRKNPHVVLAMSLKALCSLRDVIKVYSIHFALGGP